MERAGFEMVQHEREAMLKEALDECQKKGVCKEKLLTLVYETGARWVPEDNQARR